jgi:hypothetical protein
VRTGKQNIYLKIPIKCFGQLKWIKLIEKQIAIAILFQQNNALVGLCPEENFLARLRIKF